MNKVKLKKMLIRSLKIGIGTCMSILIATTLGLEYAASSGTITLLTILTTKWETLRLSLYRVLTLCISVVVGGILFVHIDQQWIAFGIFVFILTFVCEILNWRAALSVNAVIGTHFLISRDFSMESIINEFWLLMIGITAAIILNLFNENKSHKNRIIQHMRDTERDLQSVLKELALYLKNEEMKRDVWEDLRMLEENLQHYLTEAQEYKGNTFQSHPEYYIDYFRMRRRQCHMLQNLHSELQKIREMPSQAKIISEYMLYMADYVTEMNVPERQMRALEKIFDRMKLQPLPVTRKEFESRAMLYHILMDLEDFLLFKKQFVEHLSEEQKGRYWNLQ